MGSDENRLEEKAQSTRASENGAGAPAQIVKREWNERQKDRGKAIGEKNRNAKRFPVAQTPGLTVKSDGNAAKAGHGYSQLSDRR